MTQRRILATVQSKYMNRSSTYYFFPSIHPSKCLLMPPSMQSLGLAYELFPANTMSEATFALDRSSPQEWNIGMDNHLCKHLQELSKHGKMPRRETEQTEGRRANTVPERREMAVVKNCCTHSQFHLDGQTGEMNEVLYPFLNNSCFKM